MDRIHQFKDEGRTIVVVSHAPDVMRQICNRVVVIDAGRVICVAPPGEAIRAYRDSLIETGEVGALPGGDEEAAQHRVATSSPATHAGGGSMAASHRAGEGGHAAGEGGHVAGERRVAVTGYRVELPEPDRQFVLPGEALTIVVELKVRDRIPDVAFGCSVFDGEGDLVFDCDSIMLGDHYDLEPGSSTVSFQFRELPLLDGRYTVNVRVQDSGGGVVHARQEPAAMFEVVNPGRATGVVALPLTVHVKTQRPEP